MKRDEKPPLGITEWNTIEKAQKIIDERNALRSQVATLTTLLDESRVELANVRRLGRKQVDALYERQEGLGRELEVARRLLERYWTAMPMNPGEVPLSEAIPAFLAAHPVKLET
jgi:hypothetical protein